MFPLAKAVEKKFVVNVEHLIVKLVLSKFVSNVNLDVGNVENIYAKTIQEKIIYLKSRFAIAVRSIVLFVNSLLRRNFSKLVLNVLQKFVPNVLVRKL